MARKKRGEEHVNHERWLVSYADFMTLLFAFFVVMYAAAQSDRAKAQDISESVRRAIAEGGLPSALRDILRGAHPPQDLPKKKVEKPPVPPAASSVPVDLEPSMNYLKSQLKLEILTGKMQIAMEPRGIVISLRERGFFPSGGDVLYQEASASMGKIAEVLRDLPNPVRLEGHTDSVPIHNGRFRNNWELSSARSIAVLGFFNDRYQIPTQRFAVAGYADNLPVAENDSEEGRSRNRRVDIVILNKEGLRTEAGPAAPGAPAAAPAQTGGAPSAHGRPAGN